MKNIFGLEPFRLQSGAAAVVPSFRIVAGVVTMLYFRLSGAGCHVFRIVRSVARGRGIAPLMRAAVVLWLLPGEAFGLSMI